MSPVCTSPQGEREIKNAGFPIGVGNDKNNIDEILK
jgi:hypothetical protein